MWKGNGNKVGDILKIRKNGVNIGEKEGIMVMSRRRQSTTFQYAKCSTQPF